MNRSTSLALAASLLLALACGSGETPPPAATGPMSPPVSVTVTVDAAAEAELNRRGESIQVLFTVFDSRMDDGTYREFDGTLGASGGTVSVPPLSTAPGALGEVLSHWSVSVTSARKVFPDNLLRCTDASDAGDATPPPATITIECSLLRPPTATP